jgi:hypothetical protein
MKTNRGMRLRMRRGTTRVPRTLHPVASTMKAPITAATTRMPMPYLSIRTQRAGDLQTFDVIIHQQVSSATRSALLRLTQGDEPPLQLRTLRQHDYGLTVKSFQFNDDSEEPAG